STPSHFDAYNTLGRLHVFIDPAGEKFQVHLATNSFFDASDRRIDGVEFIDRLPKSAVSMLRSDLKPDQNGDFLKLPPALLDEKFIAKCKEIGLSQPEVLATHPDGTCLKHMRNALAIWANGIIS